MELTKKVIGVTDIWFPLYIGDYLRKASHLSQGEHGAFFSFLLYYYSRGCPIPNSKRYAIAYAHAEQERCNVDAVLGEFFYLDGDVWRSKRCDEELKKRQDLSQKRKEAADKRWDKDDASADAKALQLDTQPQPPSQPHSGKIPKEDLKGVLSKVGLKGFDVMGVISDDGREAARKAAPTWDIYHLAGIYNTWIQEKGRPKDINKAFPAWCASYTKGKTA